MPPPLVWHDHCMRCHNGTIETTKPPLTINFLITITGLFHVERCNSWILTGF